jgi:DNA-binding LytR/AlgR family response regulator
MDAFEQGVVDYVLKPVEPERLKLTAARLKTRWMQRTHDLNGHVMGDVSAEAKVPATNHALASHSVQQLLHSLAAQVSGRPAHYLSWLQASVGQTIQMVAVDDVLYCVSDEKYTRVQTAQQEFLIRKPIKELVDELDPAKFWQIHRSTLVNVKAIAGVVRDERGRQAVALKGRSEKLQVSRSASQLFRSM